MRTDVTQQPEPAQGQQPAARTASANGRDSQVDDTSALQPAPHRIHLSKADITQLEEQYVLEAVRSGWVAPLGPQVDAFESEMAARLGVAGALALSSGTAALHLVLLDAGARAGRAVLIPSMTFAATANAVAYTGAEPVFIDSQSSDANVDPALVIDAVDTLRHEGVDIAAVVTVDLFGRCVDYSRLVGQLADRGIPLIEDAAEALGASHAGRPAGTFGIAGALSFNGNKIVTTSGGGMLVSDDLDLLARCRYLATQARQPVPYYQHTDIGYNYRLSNLLAALGRAQLARLDSMIARRRSIRHRYVDGLSDIPGIRFLGRGVSDDAPGDTDDNCWLTCIAFDSSRTDLADDLVAQFAALNVEARHLWKPMHLQPVFERARAFTNGVSQRLFETGITLPSGSALGDDDIDFVIRAMREIAGRIG